MISNQVANWQRSGDRIVDGISTKVEQVKKSVQKTVSDNKQSLLANATVIQDLGDQVSVAGGVIAIAGVGATPGAIVAGGGKLASLTGIAIEVAVESIAGNGKNAKITIANEVAYDILGKTGNKVFDQLFPGPTPNIS